MRLFSNALNQKRFLIVLGVFVLLMAISYLPKINHVGFLQDDWNVIFVAEKLGPGSLTYHYSIDRPLQGYLVLSEYRLFGSSMPVYLTLALVFRFLDAAVLFLILLLVWPNRWRVNLIIASLALIYPGFHEQTHAFNYQTQFLSRLCMLLSIYTSLLPFYIKKSWQKPVLVVVSLIFAQLGYGFLDYQIGMEALRIGLLVAAALHQPGLKHWWKTALYAGVYLLGAGAFTYWRLFLFESKRESVNAAAMFSDYSDLWPKLLENGRSLIQNLYRLVISAYYKPLTVFSKEIDAGDWVMGVILALLAAAIVLFVSFKFIRRKSGEEGRILEKHYPVTLILVGLVGCIGALIPIIFGGRELLYTMIGDRYSYPGSVSACILMAGLIWLLKPRWLRMCLIGVLVFLAVLTQFANNVIFEKNGDQTRAVWWQMSWRAPQLQPETLLGGRIFLGMLDEDYTLWGPANLVYYPNGHEVIITAEVLDETTLPSFLAPVKVIAERKGIEFEKDFGNPLIFSKTENACLHVIDGLHPEYSEGDDTIIREVGSLSESERIDVGSDYDPRPREDLFGREPEHGWCYFYQKGQLARQTRDWQLTAQLGNKAIEEGFIPSDTMEWLVFLQAFAYTGDENYLPALHAVKTDDYTARQACQVFSSYTDELTKTEFSNAHEQLLKDVCGTAK